MNNTSNPSPTPLEADAEKIRADLLAIFTKVSQNAQAAAAVKAVEPGSDAQDASPKPGAPA